ncbi:hypothetical protein EST38_g11731 [Candolleomyces aberdarensis]|uniref:Uncharacterized protein n=1 Tax=Candolleomyces aberdarensis TaxID=2316362 RepID=A0A4Q2D5N4_9AGAR|nr:hypothetical protein EST38_g11731 [Candolleomyces aberdarensis]
MSLGSYGSGSGDKVEVKGKRVVQQIGSDETSTPPVALGGYKPQAGVLRLVFVDPIENLRNYALVPFPETYEEAQEAAVETLGEHMVDPTNANVELRGVTRGRDGEWISTFIRPRDWAAIVAESFCEVLVVNKPAAKGQTTKAASSHRLGVASSLGLGHSGGEDSFLHGHLWFTAGKKVNGRMEWTKVERAIHDDGRGPVTPWIDRPTSYQEALGLVVGVMRGDYKIQNNLVAGGSTPGAGKLPEPNDNNKFPVKFYSFASPDDKTSAWRPFPEAAYLDETVWKRVVPAPGEKLGVAVEV